MRRATIWISLAVAICLSIAMGLTLTAARQPASPAVELTAGKVPLMSAGALTFGPPKTEAGRRTVGSISEPEEGDGNEQYAAHAPGIGSPQPRGNPRRGIFAGKA